VYRGTGPTKRQKELAREEKRKEKLEKKEKRKQQEKENPVPDGVDPDIAGIVPGPQPIPDEAL
jgi:hypothetical protein